MYKRQLDALYILTQSSVQKILFVKAIKARLYVTLRTKDFFFFVVVRLTFSQRRWTMDANPFCFSCKHSYQLLLLQNFLKFNIQASFHSILPHSLKIQIAFALLNEIPPSSILVSSIDI